MNPGFAMGDWGSATTMRIHDVFPRDKPVEHTTNHESRITT